MEKDESRSGRLKRGAQLVRGAEGQGADKVVMTRRLHGEPRHSRRQSTSQRNRHGLLANQMWRVLLVFAEVLDELRIWQQLERPGGPPRLEIRLGIIDGELNL